MDDQMMADMAYAEELKLRLQEALAHRLPGAEAEPNPPVQAEEAEGGAAQAEAVTAAVNAAMASLAAIIGGNEGAGIGGNEGIAAAEQTEPEPETVAEDAGAAAAVPPGKLCLTIKAQDGHEVFFRVRPTIKFAKMFKAYCDKKSLHVDSVRFLFDGARITGAQTPAMVSRHTGISGISGIQHPLHTASAYALYC